MKSNKPSNPQQVCELILIEDKRYNIERNILPSENEVIDRLLARGTELKDAYSELYNKLHQFHPALNVFLGLLLSTAAFWNIERIAEARAARRELNVVNNEIAEKAAELAELMRRRDDLNNTTGFSSNTHYSICDVIKIASRNNSRFAVYVEEKLDILSTQFDLKYWPTIADCMEELANNAEAASPKASDRLTAVATSASRPSLADFVKALFEAINESSSRNYGHFPIDFKVTDNSLASLVNCALNLNPEDFVDGPYIKRLRQRRNEGKKEKENRLGIR